MIRHNGFDSLQKLAQDVPFDVFPQTLYTRETLLDGFRANDADAKAQTYDRRVYRHYIETGKLVANAQELALRALHDQSISAALDRYLSRHDHKKIVGIMGGHALLRTDLMYRKIALLSKRLTELGYLMVSGGGSGAMEATHLGAWTAHRSNTEVKEIFSILSKAPSSESSGWLETAFEVIERFPQTEFESLSVPSWLYSHEPSNIFATSIAKYFDNNTREQRLLAMPLGGMVFTPGSAGTFMEIFEEAALNHYATYGSACPMIFMNERFWCEKTPMYPFLKKMISQGHYKNLDLMITDNLTDVIERIEQRQKN